MSYRTIPFSVDEYADIVGVNKGFDDWACKSRAPAEGDLDPSSGERFKKIAECSRVLTSEDVDPEDVDAFHEELCARYLPVVIDFRTWIRGPQASVCKDSLFDYSFGAVLDRASDESYASLARYIREHSDSKGFMFDLLDAMPNILPTLDDLGSAWDSESAALSALGALNTLLDLLQRQLVLRPDAPAVLRISRTPLVRQLDSLDEYFRGHQRDNAYHEQLRTETGAKLNSVLSSLVHQSVNEIRTWVDRTPTAQVKFFLSCVAFEEGQCVQGGELMMCGKCKAVWYCSRAHQKKDWKEHKKTCFEPSW